MNKITPYVIDYIADPTMEKAGDMHRLQMTGPTGTYTYDHILYQGFSTIIYLYRTEKSPETTRLVMKCPFFHWLYPYVNEKSLWSKVYNAVRVLELYNPNLKNMCGCTVCGQVCNKDK